MHDRLFKDIHFVQSENLNTLAIYPLKFNNEINAFLINLSFFYIILFH